jgi:hypothetical protein
LSRAAVNRAAASSCVKSDPGLFQNTTLAKTAAERCWVEGYLRSSAPSKGKAARGSTSSPKKAVLPRLRSGARFWKISYAAEARQSDVETLSESASKMRQGLESMQAMITEVMPRLAGSNPRYGTVRSQTVH